MADVKNTPSTQNNNNNENEIDLLEIAKSLFLNKKIIVAITVLFSLIGVVIALFSTPIYQADALIQIENNKNESLFGNMGSMLGGSSSSSTEIELIRSRMVLGKTITDLELTTQIEPAYFPIVGKGWARLTGKPTPKLMVSRFQIDESLEGEKLTLVVEDSTHYTVTVGERTLTGQVGEILKDANLTMLVSDIAAPDGTKFHLTKMPFSSVLTHILTSLRVVDKGKDTGILLLSFSGPDKQKIQQILDSVSQNYLLQNIDRKSEEVGRSLEFLNTQLPEIRVSLSDAENKLNQYRQQNESVDLSLEAKSILDRVVTVDAQLKELSFAETEISKLYTKNHPTYRALMEKKRSLEKSRDVVNKKVGEMPKTQQEILRLTREMESGQAVYMRLLNKQQELQINKASTIGNVRIIDPAMVQTSPIKPKKTMIVIVAMFLGFLVSLGVVFAKMMLHLGIRKAEELENIGLNVYAVVPLSVNLKTKSGADGTFSRHQSQKKILSLQNPLDPSVEAVRSLRTTLHFAMMNAKNNILMISGATAGVGKSFISSNLACVIAQSNNKVLLIDCDMRKGYIHQMFGMDDARKGLSNFLARKAGVDDIVAETPVKNLDFISRGQVPPNPSELLMSQRFKELLDWANENYNLVILDTPPILPVTDAAIIGCHVGCSLIVTRYNVSTIKDVQMSYSRFMQNGVEIKGVILNAVEQESLDYKYSYYGYLDEQK